MSFRITPMNNDRKTMEGREGGGGAGRGRGGFGGCWGVGVGGGGRAK